MNGRTVRFASLALASAALMAGGTGPSLAHSGGHAGTYGTATYYGHSGALTAAHRTLPLGAAVRVTNRLNGRSVVVRIVDRGPAAWTGHIIDVSPGAARALGMIRAGVARVQLVAFR